MSESSIRNALEVPRRHRIVGRPPLTRSVLVRPQKLRAALRGVGYREPLLDTFTGDVRDLLPLLHFSLLHFSPRVARFLVEQGCSAELAVTTDARFVQAV